MSHISIILGNTIEEKINNIETLFTLDSDFCDSFDQELASKLIHSVNGDFEKAVEQLVEQKFTSPGQDEECPEDYGFYIGNSGYAHEYEIEYLRVGAHRVLIISYDEN